MRGTRVATPRSAGARRVIPAGCGERARCQRRRARAADGLFMERRRGSASRERGMSETLTLECAPRSRVGNSAAWVTEGPGISDHRGPAFRDNFPSPHSCAAAVAEGITPEQCFAVAAPPTVGCQRRRFHSPGHPRPQGKGVVATCEDRLVRLTLLDLLGATGAAGGKLLLDDL